MREVWRSPKELQFVIDKLFAVSLGTPDKGDDQDQCLSRAYSPLTRSWKPYLPSLGHVPHSREWKPTTPLLSRTPSAPPELQYRSQRSARANSPGHATALSGGAAAATRCRVAPPKYGKRTGTTYCITVSRPSVCPQAWSCVAARQGSEISRSPERPESAPSALAWRKLPHAPRAVRTGSRGPWHGRCSCRRRTGGWAGGPVRSAPSGW